MTSTLYIISTPIGNKKDISLRAVETLSELRILAVEDSRVTKKLLNLLDIDYGDKKFIRIDEIREKKNIEQVINELLNDNDVGLVSDSGTPLISDPGFPLVREVVANHPEIKIEVLPGANAVLPALIISGFPIDKFSFLGFLPKKKSALINLLNKLKAIDETFKQTYFAYESPFRIEKLLTVLNENFKNEIELSISREITKKFENTYRGTPSDLLEMFKNGELRTKGEFVVVLRFVD